MRAALWLLILFCIAAAVALFAGNNQGTVTVFWPPYRLDFSLNMVLLLLLGGFVLLYAALRAIASLLSLPHQARRWRVQQKERAMHLALLDGLAHRMAGRFIRARKAAEAALAQESALADAKESPPHALQLRTLAHLMAAQSAHALQDSTGRDAHLQKALADIAPPATSTQVQELREGAHLRAARWAIDDRDASAALEWLAALPVGAARRTLALRIRLKATRLAGRTQEALDTARLLAKHRAFSPAAAHSIMRGLATELIDGAHDTEQLQNIWLSLEASERAMPELAVHAAQRLSMLGGEASQVRTWLLPVWERMVADPEALATPYRIRLFRTLEAGLESVDANWLARIETAQQRNPRDTGLQYLAGVACFKRQLWGRAQMLLGTAAQNLQDTDLRTSAWRYLAALAEQRGDAEATASAWKQAALVH
ncbi:MAG TPA: heme biosynthesis HemY N-terminal domain-containing protein [Burkholderiaceae bacterium]